MRKRPFIVKFWPVVNQETLVRLGGCHHGKTRVYHLRGIVPVSVSCQMFASGHHLLLSHEKLLLKKKYFDVDCIAHNICLFLEWELSRSGAKLFTAPCRLAAVSVLSSTLSFSNIGCELEKKTPSKP